MSDCVVAATRRGRFAVEKSAGRRCIAPTLAFGSTTGSLWVTERQGERGHAVSEHLPPVRCVRFAT